MAGLLVVLFSSRIEAHESKLLNPPEFPDKVLADLLRLWSITGWVSCRAESLGSKELSVELKQLRHRKKQQRRVERAKKEVGS